MRKTLACVGILAVAVLTTGCKPPPPVAKAAPVPPQPVKMERVKAEKGVAKQGRSLDGERGVIVTPIKALFGAKEDIAFEFSFRHQYDLYRVTGEVPKDFDDLTAKVLKPLLIKLPELPAGHKYIWDAEAEELMVERPMAE